MFYYKCSSSSSTMPQLTTSLTLNSVIMISNLRHKGHNTNKRRLFANLVGAFFQLLIVGMFWHLFNVFLHIFWGRKWTAFGGSLSLASFGDFYHFLAFENHLSEIFGHYKEISRTVKEISPGQKNGWFRLLFILKMKLASKQLFIIEDPQNPRISLPIHFNTRKVKYCPQFFCDFNINRWSAKQLL